MIAVEQEFELPIVNPRTGRKSRKFALGGKIDAIAEDEDGRLWILENKTVGIGLESFRETFGLNNQYTHLLLCCVPTVRQTRRRCDRSFDF